MITPKVFIYLLYNKSGTNNVRYISLTPPTRSTIALSAVKVIALPAVKVIALLKAKAIAFLKFNQQNKGNRTMITRINDLGFKV
ncbi:MAG TPA: hypothetical protein DCQ51_14485 [Planktothrix sp. UBA8407]|nr:hypothetical protein [Planktothrix sp. UBA8407]